MDNSNAEVVAREQERQRYMNATQCDTATIEVPTIVRELRRRTTELERQRHNIDMKLATCRDLLAAFL